ncbi:hypothetical protein AHF37_01478 [Paragonimus kellicotti]|nr:hypothetical protein AHF37_01478 [Paragonimus kellicotti]
MSVTMTFDEPVHELGKIVDTEELLANFVIDMPRDLTDSEKALKKELIALRKMRRTLTELCQIRKEEKPRAPVKTGEKAKEEAMELLRSGAIQIADKKDRHTFKRKPKEVEDDESVSRTFTKPVELEKRALYSNFLRGPKLMPQYSESREVQCVDLKEGKPFRSLDFERDRDGSCTPSSNLELAASKRKQQLLALSEEETEEEEQNVESSIPPESQTDHGSGNMGDSSYSCPSSETTLHVGYHQVTTEFIHEMFEPLGTIVRVKINEYQNSSEWSKLSSTDEGDIPTPDPVTFSLKRYPLCATDSQTTTSTADRWSLYLCIESQKEKLDVELQKDNAYPITPDHTMQTRRRPTITDNRTVVLVGVALEELRCTTPKRIKRLAGCSDPAIDINFHYWFIACRRLFSVVVSIHLPPIMLFRRTNTQLPVRQHHHDNRLDASLIPCFYSAPLYWILIFLGMKFTALKTGMEIYRSPDRLRFYRGFGLFCAVHTAVWFGLTYYQDWHKKMEREYLRAKLQKFSSSISTFFSRGSSAPSAEPTVLPAATDVSTVTSPQPEPSEPNVAAGTGQEGLFSKLFNLGSFALKSEEWKKQSKDFNATVIPLMTLTLGVFTFAMGIIIPRRIVRRITLIPRNATAIQRNSARNVDNLQMVEIQTYGAFGLRKEGVTFQTPLTTVSAVEPRSTNTNFIHFFVKHKPFRFIVETFDAEFPVPEEYDYTFGLKRDL